MTDPVYPAGTVMVGVAFEVGAEDESREVETLRAVPLASLLRGVAEAEAAAED